MLRVNDHVVLLPGVRHSGSCYTPLHATVTSLHSESQSLAFAVCGGLIAVGLTVDPFVTKSDSLVGQVLCAVPPPSADQKDAAPVQLPPVFVQAQVSYKLMNRLPTARADAKTQPASASATEKSAEKDEEWTPKQYVSFPSLHLSRSISLSVCVLCFGL